MKVTKDVTIGQLCESGEWKPFSDYFFTKMTDDVWNNTLEHYGFEKCGFEETLNRLKEKGDGACRLYGIYEEEEIHAEPDKEAVKLIFMPAGTAGTGKNPAESAARADKPYVLVCPGGAYARQWGIIEGLAVGARLNKMGYPAFILYYRTLQKPPFTTPLKTKPEEDLANAIRWITDRHEEFRVKAEGYAVAGFSAGAHLAAEWGTVNLGSRNYDLPQPAALILGYPAVSMDVFYDGMEQLSGPARETASYFLARMEGENFTRESLHTYSINLHMDEKYPPVYLVACKDDPIVPIVSSYIMKEKMDELRIPYQSEIAAHGGHSFGVADGTELDGWLGRAVRFWESVR